MSSGALADDDDDVLRVAVATASHRRRRQLMDRWLFAHVALRRN